MSIFSQLDLELNIHTGVVNFLSPGQYILPIYRYTGVFHLTEGRQGFHQGWFDRALRYGCIKVKKYFLLTEPPGKPTNIKTTSITSNSVDLEWTASTPGTETTGKYHIVCTNCPLDYIINVTTTATKIKLTNLAAYAQYTIRITKENNVTMDTNIRYPSIFKFNTTKGSMFTWCSFFNIYFTKISKF